MRISTCIEENAIDPAPALLNECDEISFAVRLVKFDLNLQVLGFTGNIDIDVLHRLPTVDPNLPLAKHVQVRTVNDSYTFSHPGYPPLCNCLSLLQVTRLS